MTMPRRAYEKPDPPRRYRSLIGGALGDVGFEAGDTITVPPGKVDAWLAAGLIEPLPQGEDD